MIRFLLIGGLLVPCTTWADDGRTSLGGRVFARVEASRIEGQELLTLGSIESARIEGKYEWDWLRAVVEVELSDGADLKDGYARGTFGEWRTQAGQFKEPVSAIEMESRWVLPMTARGLLHDVLTDGLQIGFRYPGIMASWRRSGNLSPRAYMGVFQGAGASGDLERDMLKSAARVSVEPGPVELALSLEQRDAKPVDGLGIKRFWAAGIDATVSIRGLRVWAEALGGSSWIDSIVDDAGDATFLMARVIAAYRFGGNKTGHLYVEPFFMGGAFDPDLDVRKDLVSEVVGGVNVGAWRRLRVQLEVAWYDAKQNTPASFGVQDRIALIGQVGAKF